MEPITELLILSAPPRINVASPGHQATIWNRKMRKEMVGLLIPADRPACNDNDPLEKRLLELSLTTGKHLKNDRPIRRPEIPTEDSKPL